MTGQSRSLHSLCWLRLPIWLLVVGLAVGAAAAQASAADTPSLPRWVVTKPGPSTQVQKSADARGGINPCGTPDPGFVAYDRWTRLSGSAQMLAPKRFRSKTGFDVMVHFHGQEAVRKEWVQVMSGPVFVGVDLGVGSTPYHAAFRSPDAFSRLLRRVERAVAKKAGRPRLRVRRVGISAWSAGYAAVREILRRRPASDVVDTVILLDGLHTGYRNRLLSEAPLEPFVRYAALAAKRRRFMFVSHSSIIPPGYASTTETANYLVFRLGGRPRQTRPRGTDPMGLDLISLYVKGDFHVRGYAGNDKLDHCAHIGLYRDVLRYHVRPRWR